MSNKLKTTSKISLRPGYPPPFSKTIGKRTYNHYQVIAINKDKGTRKGQKVEVGMKITKTMAELTVSAIGADGILVLDPFSREYRICRSEFSQYECVKKIKPDRLLWKEPT
jgi:hypothetical protein